ncbi:MAG: DUF1553 domain-containing protein [Pirellulales bacterium]
MKLIRVFAILILSHCASVGSAQQSIDRSISFQRIIRPLLSDRCFHCHGPDEKTRQADLRLDQWQSASSVIDQAAPDQSVLLKRISSTDPSVVMPPPEINKPLTTAEKSKLKQWIAEGAIWQKHWAYEPPQRHQVPSDYLQNDWARNWIDWFVAKKLNENSLRPNPDVDRITLLRRVSFDLTGLPPRDELLKRWQSGSMTMEQAVDELLNSPQFGERMAIYWLDLVRYADTVGYHGDQDHNISAYRDWIINAFNQGMPFNQMTIEQLAGDLLPSATDSQRIATGYNRLLQTTHEGGLQPKEYRAIYAADRVRNVSAVWLAGTMGCSQCHDHKFDPFTMKDFYAMSAFFADIDDESHFKTGSNDLPTRRDPELELPTAEQTAQVQQLEREIKDLNKRIAALEKQNKASSKSDEKANNKSEKDAHKSNQSGQPNEVAQASIDQAKAQLKEQQSQLAKLKKSIRRTMITVALKEPRPTRILPRGNWLDESGSLVEPAFPEFLAQRKGGNLTTASNAVEDSSTATHAERLTRLDLAKWFVDPQKGVGLMTARVMVNRLWYLMFGTGLSRGLDEFGNQGEAPTHPELLDQLAHHLIDSGWDIRATLKLIACSRTYQQSSRVDPVAFEKDPGNLWIARQNALRLPAEMIRDNALAVSGLLVEKVGGESVRPYQPAGYYKHLNFPERDYKADQNENQWRRGVYMHWQRQFLHPMLRAFDATSREECTAQRPRSNTPLSALTLLNDPSFVEAARALAEKMLEQETHGNDTKDHDAERISSLYRLVLNRPATKVEAEVLLELVQMSRQQFRDHPENARQLMSVGLKTLRSRDFNSSANEFEELATWTQISRAVLNLAETTTRY